MLDTRPPALPARPSPYNANKQAICAANWDGQDSGCSRCPIRAECLAGPTNRLSRDDMDEWRARVNAAADAAMKKTEAL